MSVRAVIVVVAVSALREPSCGTNTTAGGPNAPCTRTSDCEGTLSCVGGFCASSDAGEGQPPDAAAQGEREAGAFDGAGAE